MASIEGLVEFSLFHRGLRWWVLKSVAAVVEANALKEALGSSVKHDFEKPMAEAWCSGYLRRCEVYWVVPSRSKLGGRNSGAKVVSCLS